MPRALSATRLRRRLLVIKKELRAQFSEFKMFLDSKEAWFACVNNGDVEAVRYNLPTYQKSVDRQGETALMHAVRNRDIEMVRLLGCFEHSLVNNDGYTALMLAAVCNEGEACKRLVPYEMNLVLPDGRTPLMLAAAAGAVDSTINLLPYQKCRTDLMGRTALMYAAEAGQFEAAQHLVLREKEHISKDAKTALILAAQNKHWDVARILYPLESHLLPEVVSDLIPDPAKLSKDDPTVSSFGLSSSIVDIVKDFPGRNVDLSMLSRSQIEGDLERKITEMERKIASLNDESSIIIVQNQALQNQVNQMNQEIIRLQAQLDESRQDNTKKAAMISELRAGINDATSHPHGAAVNAFKQEINRLHKDADGMAQLIHQLKDDAVEKNILLAKLRDTGSAKDREIDTLRSDILGLEQKLDNANQTIRRLRAELVDTSMSSEQSKAALSASATQRDLAGKEVAKLKDENVALRHTLKKMSANIENKDNEIFDLRQQLLSRSHDKSDSDSDGETIKVMEAQLNELKNEVDRLQSALFSKEDDIQLRNQKIKELADEILRLNKSGSKIQESNLATIDQLQSEITGLLGEIQHLKAQLTEKNKQIDDMNNLLVTYKEAAPNEANKSAALELQHLKLVIDNLTAELREKDRHILDLEKTSAPQPIPPQFADLVAKNEALLKSLQDVKEQNNALIKEQNSLEALLKQKDERIHPLERQLETAMSTCAASQNKLLDKEAELVDIRRAYDKLSVENSSNEQKVKDLSDKLGVLRKEKADADATYTASKRKTNNELLDLRARLEHAQKEIEVLTELSTKEPTYQVVKQYLANTVASLDACRDALADPEMARKENQNLMRRHQKDLEQLSDRVEQMSAILRAPVDQSQTVAMLLDEISQLKSKLSNLQAVQEEKYVDHRIRFFMHQVSWIRNTHLLSRQTMLTR